MSNDHFFGGAKWKLRISLLFCSIRQPDLHPDLLKTKDELKHLGALVLEEHGIFDDDDDED